jgi:hypothetical protein
MVPVRAETATAADWQDLLHGMPVPVCWCGLAVRNVDGKATSLGCIYEGEDGRWWAAFVGERHAVTMVRGAHYILEFARENNLAIHALADNSVLHSEKFMRRFGFEPLSETLAGHEVHRWTP